MNEKSFIDFNYTYSKYDHNKITNKLKLFKRSWEWCVLNQILRLKMAPGMTETTKCSIMTR